MMKNLEFACDCDVFRFLKYGIPLDADWVVDGMRFWLILIGLANLGI